MGFFSAEQAAAVKAASASRETAVSFTARKVAAPLRSATIEARGGTATAGAQEALHRAPRGGAGRVEFAGRAAGATAASSVAVTRSITGWDGSTGWVVRA